MSIMNKGVEDMLLVIDVGNTNIVLGVYKGKRAYPATDLTGFRRAT